MSIRIDKGDYLTFASIGSALCIAGLPFGRCEIKPGIWRRHWDLKSHESRSDISRDGYLGVILYAVMWDDMAMLSRIIRAGWRNGWTMGNRGEFDYINIWPLIPTLYMARYSRWLPTIPPLAVGPLLSGFRAHLLALQILIELEAGKKSRIHRWSINRLVKANPGNPWFLALQGRITGKYDPRLYEIMKNFDYSDAAYGWGSCPGDIFYALVKNSMV